MIDSILDLKEQIKKQATYENNQPHYLVKLYSNYHTFYKKRKLHDYLTASHRSLQNLNIEIGFYDLLIQSFLMNIQNIPNSEIIHANSIHLLNLKDARQNKVFGLLPYINKTFQILVAQRSICDSIHELYKSRSEKTLYQSSKLLSDKISHTIKMYDSLL